MIKCDSDGYVLRLSLFKRVVLFFFCARFFTFPLQPHRLTLTHGLVIAYNLHEKMEVYRPHRANKEEMIVFHDEDYIEFLERISPYNAGACKLDSLFDAYV